MKIKLGLIKKLSILAILLFCLGFVAFTPTTTTVQAAPCCSTCPIPPGEPEPTPQEYCANQCGVKSGPCYNQCLNQVYSCWQWCNFGC